MPHGPTPCPYLTREFGGLASPTILARRLPWSRRIRASISFSGIIPLHSPFWQGKKRKKARLAVPFPCQKGRKIPVPLVTRPCLWYDMIINVISEGEVLSMSAVDYRRALHRIPELDNQLPETVQLVQRILAPLPCRVFSPITGSVCAWFDAGKSDAVAFRAELDALPVTEATDLPYASVHPGRMHACGHDAHTAMVLTLAEYAAEHLAELPRN
ncbi:Superoxide dismutase, partial [Dysosmobacter welbionis]